MFEQILKSLGIDPAEMRDGVSSTMEAVKEIRDRLTRIEEKLDAMMGIDHD